MPTVATARDIKTNRKPVSVRNRCRGLSLRVSQAVSIFEFCAVADSEPHPSATPNRPPWMARAARRPRTADGGPSGPLRNVPPPSERWPRASGGPERTGKGAETTQPASRMIRPAVTLTRDLVRRRHPTGASPSRRSAPGRTLSPMPSEQKGAYGGHLALF